MNQRFIVCSPPTPTPSYFVNKPTWISIHVTSQGCNIENLLGNMVKSKLLKYTW